MSAVCIGGCGKEFTKDFAAATYCIDKLIEFVCKECHGKGVRTELEKRREEQKRA